MLRWLEFRDAVNTGLLFADISLLFVLGRMLFGEMKYPNWHRHPYNTAAIALMIYFLGQAISRGWAFFLLRDLRAGRDIFAIENTYPIALLGSMVAFLGTLFIIRTFSPADERNRASIIVVGLTALMSGIAYFFSWG